MPAATRRKNRIQHNNPDDRRGREMFSDQHSEPMSCICLYYLAKVATPHDAILQFDLTTVEPITSVDLGCAEEFEYSADIALKYGQMHSDPIPSERIRSEM
jgi:hypothetical protein